MFKLKRMTALLMSVLLMGSTVCAPAMAAEVTGEEPENAAENVTTEAAEPIEQGGEAEEADVFDTSETAEEEQPEAGVIESQESSDESTVENAAGTGSVEQEDEYLPVLWSRKMSIFRL